MNNIEEQIHQLSATLSALKKDLPNDMRHRRTAYGGDFDSGEESHDSPPKLNSFRDPSSDWKPAVRNELKLARRKEIEARRFNGKENVEDYLLQFELTARRNQWSDEEKASALLCALDGPGRSIIQELEDPTTVSFHDVRTALLRRFGPTELTEVHEHALQQIKLGKNQNIRELANEVQRLVAKLGID